VGTRGCTVRLLSEDPEDLPTRVVSRDAFTIVEGKRGIEPPESQSVQLSAAAAAEASAARAKMPKAMLHPQSLVTREHVAASTAALTARASKVSVRQSSTGTAVELRSPRPLSALPCAQRPLVSRGVHSGQAPGRCCGRQHKRSAFVDRRPSCAW